jgi:hypothetical protein
MWQFKNIFNIKSTKNTPFLKEQYSIPLTASVVSHHAFLELPRLVEKTEV